MIKKKGRMKKKKEEEMSNIANFNNPYCRLQQDNYLVWHVQPSYVPIKYNLQSIKVQCENFSLFKFFTGVHFQVGDSFIQFCINFLSTVPIYRVCTIALCAP